MPPLSRGGSDTRARIAATGWSEVVVKPAVDGGARKTARGGATSPALLEHAHRMAIAGLVFLALALVSAVLLVTQFLFTGSASVVIIPVLLAIVIVIVWFLRPLVRRSDIETGA